MPRTAKIVRSLLFAPANRPDLFSKFPQLAADAFALDLEDGTPAGERQTARSRLAQSVRIARGDGKALIFVRINAVDTPDFAEDMEAVKASDADGILLPKARQARDLAAVGPGLPVIAGIESIEGVLNAVTIAASAAVAAVYFGAEDFAAEMGARRTAQGLEVLYARSHVVLAARAARVGALDQVVTDFRDDAQFRKDAAVGRDLGYDGKLCIHPRQVDLANEVFAPSAAEVERARRLVAAFRAAEARGEATIDFEGQMVDGPVVKAALSILAKAAPGTQ